MSEYINRDELLFELSTGFFPQSMDYTRGVSIAKQLIKEAPAADVVEVTRCKDCCRFTEDIICEGLGWCDITNKPIRDTEYCSFAVRRETDDRSDNDR